MQIRVYVDTKKTRLRLDRLAPDMLAALAAEARALDDELLGEAQGFASSVLAVRTGKFVASIKGKVRATQTGVYASVSSRDPRAHLFEYGGHTPPHEIEPESAKALKLQVASGTVFAAAVHHPGGTYPARPAILAAYNAKRSDIFTRMYEAGSRGVARGE